MTVIICSELYKTLILVIFNAKLITVYGHVIVTKIC